MKDLLLICQKMPFKDRVLIFRENERWKNLTDPLFRELMNNHCVLTPEGCDFLEIQEIAHGLEVFKVPYDLWKLTDDKAYRERRRVILEGKRGHKHFKKMLSEREKEEPIRPVLTE